MARRIVQVIARNKHQQVLEALCRREDVLDCWRIECDETADRLIYAYLAHTENSQSIIDAAQTALGYSDGMRILLLPVEAMLPKLEIDEAPQPDKNKKKHSSSGISREELYDGLAKAADLDSNFLLLTFLSTVVATIGLLENNVAVVIGAMVIAPLLGPNLAMALATALGDTTLMWRALRTNLIGISLTLALSLGIGHYVNDVLSHELISRTIVGWDSIALALASGGAAALSLTAGVSSVLVGVMVAVALMPPAVTIGIMLGSGHITEAIGASLLLAINVVCVNLSTKLVFLFKGIGFRTWTERKKAQRTMFISIIVWGSALAGLAYAVMRFNYIDPLL